MAPTLITDHEYEPCSLPIGESDAEQALCPAGGCHYFVNYAGFCCREPPEAHSNWSPDEFAHLQQENERIKEQWPEPAATSSKSEISKMETYSQP